MGTRSVGPQSATAHLTVRRRWPSWAAPAAGIWSVLFGLAGVHWALGGSGFPFGPGSSSTLRWGRWASYAAAALALPYPIVRISWALGIPLGVDWLDGALTVPERIGLVLFFFFFPLPVWGPLLGAAVVAYWLRRTGKLDAPAVASAASQVHAA